ncbi:MAG: phosphoesterase [Flavobacteriales bacterium MED-G15]|nr:MAG: phosphoesterase [Flavobacteriales bacterium MED-G15]|tara:strand:- start:4608 stop:5837 length:1230 start_codon:yes stop_codon:yes gene_type:complete
MFLRWLPFIVVILVVQWYAFQAVKTAINNKLLLGIYSLVVILTLGNFFWQFFGFNRTDGWTHAIAYAIGFFVALASLQLIMFSFLFTEDIIRLLRATISFFSNEKGFNLSGRRKFISQLAVGLGVIPFASLLYGMYRGRYNYKVLNYTLEYEDLPEHFDGFKITQISDLHCGSFDNFEKVAYGVDLINEQKGDIILFTGDMVNSVASEADPWVKVFSKIEAPFGKFSVLGNHDYGDYSEWESPAAKEKNLQDLFKIHQDMGFDLLLNESRKVEKDGQKITLVGVENWGAGRFKKAGDLNKSVAQVEKNDFKILLSHDPSHWEAEVLPHSYPFHLTLSGHTHGFQFGIEIPGWVKWSPIKWRYKQWAGIYESGNQKLNVNRGFGYLAYPGRVGIWPEITVITLKKKNLLI